MNTSDHHLKPIMIQRKRFAHAEHTLYRVYSAPGEFQLVEANTAHEAFEKSGVNRPHKIERETFYTYPALSPQLVSQQAEGEVEMDSHLPELGDLKSVLYAALSESVNEIETPAFESLTVGDLRRQEASAAVPSATEALPVRDPITFEQASLAEVVASVPALQEPASEESEALTPEQVDALLRGE